MAKIILVSFGGPRSLDEVPLFLRELLTDQEMVRTPLPSWVHRSLFSLIACLRAPALVKKYAVIGDRSPIVEATERIAGALPHDVLPFYRYLPQTHALFLERLAVFSKGEEITGITLYPQYSMTTTGSAKTWLAKHIPTELFNRISWIDSYATHPIFIRAWVECIRSFLAEKGIPEEETTLLFSAHGLPQKIVDQGDPYQKECEASFQAVAKAFSKARSLLAYQSKSGWGRWLQPETVDVCKTVKGKKHVVMIPIAFTTDHIETLYEIEYEYLPLIKSRGLGAHRCPIPNIVRTLSRKMTSKKLQSRA